MKDYVTTKVKGETYDEAEKRNNYFKNQGKKEALEDELKFLENLIVLSYVDYSGDSKLIRDEVKEIKKRLDGFFQSN